MVTKKRIIEDLENLKNTDIQLVSWGLFNTLLKIPFSKLEHLYYLLDREYEKKVHSNITFHELRIQGERQIRIKARNDSAVRITLDEIYKNIHETYKVEKKLCNELLEQEKKIIITVQ